MALPPNFPESPHAILAPDARWEPGRGDLFEMLPPLVSRLRQAAAEGPAPAPRPTWTMAHKNGREA